MLPFSQRQRYLGQTALSEIHPQRNEGESTLLGTSKESSNLLLVKEKLPAALGIVSLYAAVTIRTYMSVIEKHFAVFHPGVAVLKTDFTFTEGFYLHTLQSDASFIGIDDMVIMPRSSVLHDPLDISQLLSTPIKSVGICGKVNYTTDSVIRQVKSHRKIQKHIYFCASADIVL